MPMISFAFILVILGFFSCQQKQKASMAEPVAMSEAPARQVATVKYDPNKFFESLKEIDRAAGERYVPGDSYDSEVAEHMELIKLFSYHFNTKYESLEERKKYQDQGDDKYALRGVHAKGHGCLTGSFTTKVSSKREFQYGVFRSDKTYPVVIRVSNGDGPPHHDSDRKISIGFAFKILDFDGVKLEGSPDEKSVDFLFTNHPNFIVKDIQGFVQVIQAREHKGIQNIGGAYHAGWGLIGRVLTPKKDPLVTEYWGNLPFKIGDTTVVKYLMRPTSCKGEKVEGVPINSKDRDDRDFLSKTLAKHIEKKEVCFKFYLNERHKKNPDYFSPVEDAFKSWPEEGLITEVGFLRIDMQKPNEKIAELPHFKGLGKSGKEICQHISFTPWNTTDDFKPLSSLNRARKLIYDLSIDKRRKLNKASNPVN